MLQQPSRKNPVSGRLKPGDRWCLCAARWQEALGDVPSLPASPGKTPIVLLELRDAALERAEAEHPWAKVPRFKLRDRPVALALVILLREP